MNKDSEEIGDPLQLLKKILNDSADSISESQRKENPVDWDRHMMMRVFADLIGQNTFEKFIAKQRENAANMTAQNLDEEVRRFHEENHVDIAAEIRKFGDRLGEVIEKMMPKTDPDDIVSDLVSGDGDTAEKLFQGKAE